MQFQGWDPGGSGLIRRWENRIQVNKIKEICTRRWFCGNKEAIDLLWVYWMREISGRDPIWILSRLMEWKRETSISESI